MLGGNVLINYVISLPDSPHSSDDEESIILKQQLRRIRREKLANQCKHLRLRQLLELEQRSSGVAGESKYALNYFTLLYSKTCLKRPLQKKAKIVFKTDYRLMQVKRIAECSNWEHSAILSTFIKLPFVINIFVLSIF